MERGVIVGGVPNTMNICGAAGRQTMDWDGTVDKSSKKKEK